MLENYFWGKVDVQINAFMSGTAWNLKKMMQKLREEFLRIIFRLFFLQDFCCAAVRKRS
jgi:IS5 family transposase